MARVEEWAACAGQVPWHDINEGAQRLGVKGLPKPSNEANSDRHSKRTIDPPAQRKRDSNLKDLSHSRATAAAKPDNDAVTRIRDGEIHRESHMAGYQRPSISSENLSAGRPALSTEGWNEGEPSIGASEEKDMLAGLGKKTLESGALRTALKRLHESIMGKPSIQHAFYDFDKNHDNQISLDEFLEACGSMQTQLPKSQLSEVHYLSSDFCRLLFMICLCAPFLHRRVANTQAFV